MTGRPSDIGARTEAEVITALIRCGTSVFLPVLTPSRSDLVFEDEHGLHRVQCKTGRLMGDTIFFPTCSNTGGERADYRGQADYFAVYSPELDQTFLVPVADVPLRGCHLRLGTARNGQRKGIRWAADYRI